MRSAAARNTCEGRRSFLKSVAGCAAGVAASGLLAAPAIARVATDIRSLVMVNDRTGESINSVYWIAGDYILEALTEFNNILRDWRAELVIDIDPRTLDILSAVHAMLETSEPFQIVSGYRSAATNAALRRRQRGVARNSYHIRGMAVDITLDSRSVGQMHSAAMALSAGGVGKYTRSKFVHLDSGPVRDWGR